VAGDGRKVSYVSRAMVAGGSWAVAGGFAAWAAARIAAADRVQRTEGPVVPFISFTPQVAKAAPWAALGLQLAGQRRPAATTAAAAAALRLVVRSRAMFRMQPGASGPMLRVLTFNMFFGRGDAEVLVARVRQLSPDVLFLQELTADAVTRLKQAGLEELLPHNQVELRGGPRGSGIYSRFPLGEGVPVPPAHAAQPTALLEVPGGHQVELICVHSATPASEHGGAAARWRADLAALPAPDGRPRIMAGDFNATLDHAAFRGVLGRGYADSGQQAAGGLTPTWGMPPGKRAVLTLDHVLVDRGCAVLGYSVHIIPGSDHRAVYAEIQLPELGAES
jgi:endonuclease/exonuclease/phosphatase family metal-dependent hydrolase